MLRVPLLKGYKTLVSVGLCTVIYAIHNKSSLLSTKLSLEDPVEYDTKARILQSQAALSSSLQNIPLPMRLRMEKFVKEKQAEIVNALEELDGQHFRIDQWTRKEGGEGISCVLQDGNVFEKAGVNVSVVYGKLPPAAIEKMRANHSSLGETKSALPFFAAGLSLVVHPHNPMCPTVHLNYRYFEIENEDGSVRAAWFGGGSDLTPTYLFDEDAILFHGELKKACDRHDKTYYPRFKEWCDKYFYIKHRQESRGIGGIFFDDLEAISPLLPMSQQHSGSNESAGQHINENKDPTLESGKDQEEIFAFVRDCADSYLPAYIPIVQRRKDMPYTAAEKEFQAIRRGRYVEFNLCYDRGTSFGLATPGARVESILMSLPLKAGWIYQHVPNGRREAKILEVLRNPKEWV